MADIIHELQDMRYLEWSKIRHSSGTAGSFLKAFDDISGKKIYYKLSDYNSIHGIVGHECVNELIVSRLLDVLNISHLHYTLIHALIKIGNREYETYICSSKDYKEYGESKISLEDLYQAESMKTESPIDFCIRMGWEKYIYEMLVVDYLILNRDRHGANIEVLRNSKSRKLRLAPLFDHGISFVCRCQSEEELNNVDVMEDKKIQSFVGSSSAKENLSLIPKDEMLKIGVLKESDRKMLFEGLEQGLGQPVMSEKYRNVIWNMIWERWQYFETLRNS